MRRGLHFAEKYIFIWHMSGNKAWASHMGLYEFCNRSRCGTHMCLNGQGHMGTTWVPFTPTLRGDEQLLISHLSRGRGM